MKKVYKKDDNLVFRGGGGYCDDDDDGVGASALRGAYRGYYRPYLQSNHVGIRSKKRVDYEKSI